MRQRGDEFCSFVESTCIMDPCDGDQGVWKNASLPAFSLLKVIPHVYTPPAVIVFTVERLICLRSSNEVSSSQETSRLPHCQLQRRHNKLLSAVFLKILISCHKAAPRLQGRVPEIKRGRTSV